MSENTIVCDDLKDSEGWVPYPLYCPNCGHLNIGYKDSKGKLRYECNRCLSVLVRVMKGRRHDIIDLYPPSDEERIDLLNGLF